MLRFALERVKDAQSLRIRVGAVTDELGHILRPQPSTEKVRRNHQQRTGRLAVPAANVRQDGSSLLLQIRLRPRVKHVEILWQTEGCGRKLRVQVSVESSVAPLRGIVCVSRNDVWVSTRCR